MFVHYDSRALGAALVAALPAAGLWFLLPDGWRANAFVAFFATFTALTAIADARRGEGGRVYFMPAWMTGAVGLSAAVAVAWGRVAWAVSLGAIVLLVAAVVVRMLWVQRHRTRVAPEALARARAAAARGDNSAVWRELPHAFYRPLGGTFSAAWIQHDAEVLALAQQWSGAGLSPDRAHIANLARVLQVGAQRRSPMEIDRDAARRTEDALFSIAGRAGG